jgi:UDP-N-acetylmuramoylalanine--D-glutamate ligase
MKLDGRHILILGLGESGLAMVRWCARQGAKLRVADTRATPPYLPVLRREVPGAEFVSGEFAKPLLSGIDLLALSPGLSGGLMVVLHARARGIPVLGEIELFAHALRDLGVREATQVIAITGTNGKTTTTALTGHLCRAAGIDVEVAGNISPAALDALIARLDAGRLPRVWVLELSSFQMETLESLDAEVTTVLNVSDDHLDRYEDVDEYALTKTRIFHGGGAQVLNRQDARVKRMAIAGRRLISFGVDAPSHDEDFGLRDNRGAPWLVQGDRFLLPQSQLPIAGLHNAANALAALALCAAIDVPQLPLIQGLRTFRGLPHRVEKIGEIAGVTFFDDSKGTNVGATVAALNGLGGQMAAQPSQPAAPRTESGAEGDHKIALILGGDGKGQDFSPLGQAVREHARVVALIGRDAPLIEDALGACGVPIVYATDMSEAVRVCVSHARPGDAVLLSPACASWDMYRNYAHRAEVFVAAVRALGEAKTK